MRNFFAAACLGVLASAIKLDQCHDEDTDNTFAEFDQAFVHVFDQMGGQYETEDVSLAQAGTTHKWVRHVDIPKHENLGAHMVLDREQLKIVPRHRIIFNEDLPNAQVCPPDEGAQQMGGWRIFWAGIKNENIAIEKQQVRMKDGAVFIEHWDHVMTFPTGCQHAMQVIGVHLDQIKSYQDDLEAKLSDVNSRLEKYESLEQPLKAKIVKEVEQKKAIAEKAKAVVKAMKCNHAKAVHDGKKAENKAADLEKEVAELKGEIKEQAGKQKEIAKEAVKAAVEATKEAAAGEVAEQVAEKVAEIKEATKEVVAEAIAEQKEDAAVEQEAAVEAAVAEVEANAEVADAAPEVEPEAAAETD